MFLARLLLKKKMSATTGSKVLQPKWYRPDIQKVAENKPVLKLYNSLTRNKEEFVPQSGTKEISWYSCGPTVYDASHMGHARNYVSIDINRRILQDYFGYNVKFVQNVTDIDDKIILRARQNYLYEEYVKEHGEKVDSSVVDKIQLALLEYIVSNLKQDNIKNIDEFKSWYKAIDPEQERVENPKFSMYITAIGNAIKALDNSSDSATFYPLVKDVLVPVLDKELGSTLNDPEIFRKLPAYWEHRYDTDMAKLNVLQPTLTTRVSEYVPEIISYIEKIIFNGYAYAAEDGSVYFDTQKFDSSSNHDYAKCQPWNKGHLELINDAEGSLSNFASNGKKSSSDFALWKNSKPGEPEWVSPWGKGRPGWHIECSVMASDILGSSMDIHSGGVDLAFPHHDNELAQSEAHFDNKQWVNYFLHTGHLHIEGQKMSKSLKNFITIDEALESYTSRQLRLAFASAQWNNQLDFKESLINEVKSLETTFNNFFANVRALINDYKNILASSEGYVSKKIGSLERQLMADLQAAQLNVDVSFCDNLATPQVIKTLSELVTATNTYISSAGATLKIEPVSAVCKYITKIIRIIGFPVRSDELGWENTEGSETGNMNGSVEEIVMPYVQCLAKFRDSVRSLAINKADLKDFLQLTDIIRDDDLLKLNIALDDRNSQSALIKFLTDSERTEIIKLNREKAAKEQQKLKKKLEQQKLNEAKEKERMKKAKVSPEDMFINNELYVEWDAQGLPTKDKEGNEVTKSMTKKLKKQWDQQKKLHDEYLSKQ